MLSENSVRKLTSFLFEDLLNEKMQRHSINCQRISDELAVEAKREDSFISGVTNPLSPNHPDFVIAQEELAGTGGILSLNFNLDSITQQDAREILKDIIHWRLTKSLDKTRYREINKIVLKAFINLIIIIAKEYQVEINIGTSYGFNTTRLAVYDVPRSSSTYIRIAPGTENIKDIQLITSIIKRVSRIFAQALNDNKFVKLIKILSDIE